MARDTKRDRRGSAKPPTKKIAPLEELRARVKDFFRPAFKPVTELGDGPVFTSKFSGKAYIPKGEKWPTCQNCSKPMQLFIQLDLGDIPSALKGSFGYGLLQMFYCTSMDPNCECDNSGWVPYSNNGVVRVVRSEGSEEDIELPDIERCFPAKRIVGWTPIDDYPGLDDLQELGIEVPDTLLDRILDEEGKGTWPTPHQGDKLGGWPFWCQSIEYPQCRVCGKQMRLVFQIDSEYDLPYMFGDVGTGHITQCPDHKDVVTFNWACH